MNTGMKVTTGATATTHDINLPKFPTMLRKMWSGGEVQQWLDENIKPIFEAYRKRIAELESANAELERLCDETYVAQGADAYNLACEEMEDWQAERRKAGKEVGTTGSLCDGIQWLYGYIEELEADHKRGGEPVAWLRKNVFRFNAEIEPQDDSELPLYTTPQPAEPVKVPSDAISVVGVPEFDALMDHIYENGTASEGVLPLANALARALLDRYR